MYRSLRYASAVVLAMLLFHACGTGHVVDLPVKPKKKTYGAIPPISHNDSLRFKYFYYEALKQQVKGNYDAAYELLGHCLRINPYSAEAYYYLSSYDGAMNGDSMALSKMKKAADLYPENATYQERLAVGYLNVSKYAEARSVYERLWKEDHSRTDVLRILFKLYGIEKDYNNMVKVLERLEEQDGVTEQTALAKMNIYSVQGRKDEELDVLKDLSAKHPYDMNYRVMIGNWLLQNGDNAGAHAEYESVLKAEPENAMAQMSMLDYYRAVGKDSLAGALREKMLLTADNAIETKIALIKQVVDENEKNGGDSTDVLGLFAKILEQPQEKPDMAGVCLAYMNLKKMPEDTIASFGKKILADFPDEASVRLQLVQGAWMKQNFDEVIRLCKPALEYNPDEMVFYYFLGLAYIQKDDDDSTLDVFRKGVAQITESSNPDMVSDLYAAMGDILFKKNDHVSAFAAYDSCLQWKDDNIACLNNYAYYMSLQGGDLTKAEQMSYRTVKAEPANSTYLDTYAWILFLQERYAESKMYIDQAVANDSVASGVILEHAGDIYAMNGEMEKAVEYWVKAKEAGGTGKALIRKIKQRKYIKDDSR